MTGTVHLVGAGPGAADLLTLRAARLLRMADIVFHDALVPDDILSLAERARHVRVGKRCGAHSARQEDINGLLIAAAQEHETVVRLKGGDPMLFGRAQEEIDALRSAGIDVQVVPGITAAFGATSSLLQSLTERGLSRSVVFLTPRTGRGAVACDWARPAATADTAVLYMAGRDATAVTAALLLAGVPASRPCVVVESATLPGERAWPTPLHGLARTCARIGDGPALVLMGDVYADCLAAADRTLERQQFA
ncbi:MAG: uroporphyrinogen-III C-methyltransferase [Betaproteobacteria bacterium]|nr:uroporphyrinogen-III C-methyltransferase [Betaproteobacteria bacterium]